MVVPVIVVPVAVAMAVVVVVLCRCVCDDRACDGRGCGCTFWSGCVSFTAFLLLTLVSFALKLAGIVMLTFKDDEERRV